MGCEKWWALMHLKREGHAMKACLYVICEVNYSLTFTCLKIYKKMHF